MGYLVLLQWSFLALLASERAHAQAPVAIVEEVVGNGAGVEVMDYLDAGKVVSLAKGQKLVIGYLKSCWRETITEGTIVIGSDQSTVTHGKIERSKVPCDGRPYTLSAEQSRASAAMAFRKQPKGKMRSEVTLFGLMPIIEARGGGRLVIERVDQKGERFEFDISSDDRQDSTFFDLASTQKSLTAGGLYRASLGSSHVLVFKIDPQAKGGPGPVVGRLLRLRPPS